jgi:hypothetical protein
VTLPEPRAKCGAQPDATAGAFGNTTQATFDSWHEWALRQRYFIIGDKPSITIGEYEFVANRLAP